MQRADVLNDLFKSRAERLEIKKTAEFNKCFTALLDHVNQIQRDFYDIYAGQNYLEAIEKFFITYRNVYNDEYHSFFDSVEHSRFSDISKLLDEIYCNHANGYAYCNNKFKQIAKHIKDIQDALQSKKILNPACEPSEVIIDIEPSVLKVELNEETPLLANAVPSDSPSLQQQLDKRNKSYAEKYNNYLKLNKLIKSALSAFSSPANAKELIDFLDQHPEIVELDLCEVLDDNIERDFWQERWDPNGVVSLIGYFFENLPSWFKNLPSQVHALIAVATAPLWLPVFISIIAPLVMVDKIISSIVYPLIGEPTKKDTTLAITQRLADVIKHNETIKSITVGKRYQKYSDNESLDELKTAFMQNQTLVSININDETIQRQMEKNSILGKIREEIPSYLAFMSARYQSGYAGVDLPLEILEKITTYNVAQSLHEFKSAMFFKPEKAALEVAKKMSDIVAKKYEARR